MNELDTNYKPFTPAKILKPFYVFTVCIMLIFIATLIYLFSTGPNKFIKYQVQEFENLLIQSKKDYIQTAVNGVVQDIEIKEKILLAKLEKENPSLLKNESVLDSIIKKEMYFHISNKKLINNGYVWVNEVLNYNGGDNYAIRLVHPNLKNTEGEYLSTNTKDIKGNKPYLTELNGVKKDGQLFFKYWFKKPNSNKIEQKLTYAKLYKKYNWIIATGVYLDDIEELTAAEISKSKSIIQNQYLVTISIIFISFILILITTNYFKKRISNTIFYYTKEVEERELLLKEFNSNLEQLVEERTDQLNESELRYAALFKKNQSVMLLLNPETGLIIDANQAAINFYGYTFKELTSMKISEINTLPVEETKSKIKDVLVNSSKHFYFKHKLANNTIKDVEVHVEKIIVEGEEQLYSIIYDLSELKKTKKELIKAKEKAEESDRLKSAFLANMSHEIRTPMNGILGFSELLKNPKLSGNLQQEYIKIIEKSGHRMLNIINNIIDISRIESGLMKVKLEDSNINKQVEYIYKFFSPEAEAKGIKLAINNQLPAAKSIINTDSEKVYAILTNLVKNAIKYTNKGTIVFGYTKKDNYLEFYVQDTGIGIPENRKKAVFERFIQADIADKMARQGAGLGLSISKAFVKILGGDIWVESEENVGSTFYFTLPYNNKTTKEKLVNTTPISNNVGTKTNGLKVLIAEDDEISETLLSIALKDISSEIIRVKNGIEAIKKVKNTPDIDLVLMDIQMPRMSGYEATLEIRKFNKNIKIIAQTAFGLSGDREKAINVGCNDYISKPINKNELLKLIQSLFKATVV
ncbi:PAS domain S-box-containing protein [Lutibacter oricola]|uniref:histidine kinase n=1 Tax=Lutibacter oricola TaxID=762486 RepID=A0A1H2QS56_9FLAO|nr:ATP-binding protein [Lutibacter oricola]SDW10027.1 PAS domain S-box-containing protein [Lutibacter oricola]